MIKIYFDKYKDYNYNIKAFQFKKAIKQINYIFSIKIKIKIVDKYIIIIFDNNNREILSNWSFELMEEKLNINKIYARYSFIEILKE